MIKERGNIYSQLYLKRILSCILESRFSAPVQNKHICAGTITMDNSKVVRWVGLPTQIVSCSLSTHDSNYRCSQKQLSQHDLFPPHRVWPLHYSGHNSCMERVKSSETSNQEGNWKRWLLLYTETQEETCLWAPNFTDICGIICIDAHSHWHDWISQYM